MSYDLNVYLARADMPSPGDWRAAIIQAGFPVELKAEFDVETFTGFLPAPVHGKLSGFEYYASSLGSEEAQELGLGSSINFCIQFTVGSRPLELVSALAASGTLANLSGGSLVDSQSGESYSSTEALAWAKEQVRGIGV
jgi:hypothetical protein